MGVWYSVKSTDGVSRVWQREGSGKGNGMGGDDGDDDDDCVASKRNGFK